MARIEITAAELSADFNEALEHIETEHGHTSQELADLMGWGQKKMLVAMKKLIIAGSWEYVSVRRTSVLTGVTRPVNAYRLVKNSD